MAGRKQGIHRVSTLTSFHCTSNKNCMATKTSISRWKRVRASCSASSCRLRSPDSHVHHALPSCCGSRRKQSNSADSSTHALSRLNRCSPSRNRARLGESSNASAAFFKQGHLSFVAATKSASPVFGSGSGKSPAVAAAGCSWAQ